MTEALATSLRSAAKLASGGDTHSALELLAQITQEFPGSAQAYYLLGLVLSTSEHHGPAQDAFDIAAQLNPRHPHARLHACAASRDAGDLEAAARGLHALALERPGDVRVWREWAQVCIQLGDIETGLACTAAGLERHAESAEIALLRARMFELKGERDEALAFYRRTLELDPNQSAPYFRLAREGDDHLDVHAIEEQLARTDLKAEARCDLHFARALLLDRSGDVEAAWSAFQRANAAARELTSHDARAHRAFTQLLVAHAAVEAPTLAPTFDASPIFIVGMPRSGTSLVEQILAAHPEVEALGERRQIGELVEELPSYPQAIAGFSAEDLGGMASRYLAGTPEGHFTDKAPGNFHYLPLIRALFPDAKVIHVRRHPLDTCLSNWVTNFDSGSVGYSCDLEDMASFYEDYAALMDSYRKAGFDMLEVDYEDLARDPEPVMRRMVAYAGLDWDPACLDFHRSDRAVATASALQVREPAHTRSVGRWRKYEAFLGPLARLI